MRFTANELILRYEGSNPSLSSTKGVSMAKVLNCLCTQCRLSKKRSATYKQHNRNVRRKIRRLVFYNVLHYNYEIDVPEKHSGIHSA